MSRKEYCLQFGEKKIFTYGSNQQEAYQALPGCYRDLRAPEDLQLVRDLRWEPLNTLESLISKHREEVDDG